MYSWCTTAGPTPAVCEEENLPWRGHCIEKKRTKNLEGAGCKNAEKHLTTMRALFKILRGPWLPAARYSAPRPLLRAPWSHNSKLVLSSITSEPTCLEKSWNWSKNSIKQGQVTWPLSGTFGPA